MAWKSRKKHWLTKLKLFGLYPKLPLKTKTSWRVLKSLIVCPKLRKCPKRYRLCCSRISCVCITAAQQADVGLLLQGCPCAASPTCPGAVMLPSASDAALGECGEISVMTHSSVQEGCKYDTASLDSKRERKKKVSFRVSEQSHRQAALHPCELTDSLLFMGGIFHFFHRVRGESPSCPPPIQFSCHSVLHKSVSVELFWWC